MALHFAELSQMTNIAACYGCAVYVVDVKGTYHCLW